MRLRNVKNASIILKNSSYFVENPQNYFGKLGELFAHEGAIHLEIGCGKGQFLIGMAKKYPHINFIGIEKYDSVLVRAIEKCELESLTNLKFFCMDAKNLEEVFHQDIAGVLGPGEARLAHGEARLHQEDQGRSQQDPNGVDR